MYNKHNDKQIGYDQSFCSYNSYENKIVKNPYSLKDQEIYKKQNNHKKILFYVFVLFLIIILCFIL